MLRLAVSVHEPGPVALKVAVSPEADGLPVDGVQLAEVVHRDDPLADQV